MAQADFLPSLRYIRSRFLGLTRCHPIFRLCGSSPWEVEKATTQARLLSGRFMVGALTRHWVPWNREGLCTLPDCWGGADSHVGTIESFLLPCPSLSTTRLALTIYNQTYLSSNPDLLPLVHECMALDTVQFWLDCSTMPAVIAAVQLEVEGILSPLLKCTRNYCHSIYKARVELLNCGV